MPVPCNVHFMKKSSTHRAHLFGQILTLLLAETENNEGVIVALHAHAHNLVDVRLLIGAAVRTAPLAALA